MSSHRIEGARGGDAGFAALVRQIAGAYADQVAVDDQSFLPLARELAARR